MEAVTDAWIAALSIFIRGVLSGLLITFGWADAFWDWVDRVAKQVRDRHNSTDTPY
jgi:hypothetical protein